METFDSGGRSIGSGGIFPVTQGQTYYVKVTPF